MILLCRLRHGYIYFLLLVRLIRENDQTLIFVIFMDGIGVVVDHRSDNR